MEDKKILLDNIEKIHTTEMEIDRIRRNACSPFGNELNPETNLAAFSLNIANNTPIITNAITNI